MQLVNRSALTLIAEQPFVDWINEQDPTSQHSLEEVRSESSVYLLSEGDSLNEVLMPVFKEIWLIEMRGWYEDAELPKKSGLADFRNWFTAEWGSMVIDYAAGRLSSHPY